VSKKDATETTQALKEFLRRQPKDKMGRDQRPINILQLVELAKSLEGDTSNNSGRMKEYITVKAVAILQSGLRERIKVIVDNLADSNKSLPRIEEKITLEMVREFRDKEYSLGDFVAHLWSYSSVEQIVNAVERASSKCLLELFIQRGLHSGTETTNAKESTEFYNVQMARLARLFKRRNIVCHEVGPLISVTSMELMEELIAVFFVLAALGHYSEGKS
jgi:hypothetical protein